VLVEGLVVPDDPVDPVPNPGDPSVHAGEVRLAAPDAPGHDSDLGPSTAGAHLHGAAGVTLHQLEHRLV